MSNHDATTPVTLSGETLLEAVLAGTTDSVFVKDRDGRYLLINQAGARYVGETISGVLGKRDVDVFPADTAAQIREHDRLVLEGSEQQAFEINVAVGGEPRVFLSTKTPLRDGEGRIIGLIGISRDITERKQADAALRESEERMSRILAGAMDAIITVDSSLTVRLWNAAAEDMFRCTAAKAVGHSFRRFASASLRTMLERCQTAFEQRRVKRPYVWVPGGLTALRADGDEFPIEATISQFEMQQERMLTLILRDVNERHQSEERLQQLQLENRYLHEQMRDDRGSDEMVGEAPEMRAVHHAIEQVARTDATVLITGETGTGKELVARAIHRASPLADRILVKVNCAALPAGLVESELFGHEKGAFTGALNRKVGRFELADGGTIFLDEIGELPLELQSKLLRVLQEGEFERLGSSTTRRVCVRVIAATNRDLRQAVREQRFREDLYYRLNVFPIHVPPLRGRVDDITQLVRHFVLRISARMGRSIDEVPEETMTALREYQWPGNVRELQNVIERAVILSNGTRLELGAWPPSGPRHAESHCAQKLEDVERDHILAVLERVNWRVSGDRGAAKVLGLKPTTLESRMKKLGIRRNA
jgi:PAS domain S-box-containing protein